MNPKVWAEAFSVAVSSFVSLSGHVKRDLSTSLLTCAMLLGLYAGAQVIAEGGDFEAGIYRAFAMTDAYREEAARRRQADQLQAELRVITDANRVIQQRLHDLLDHTPTAARVRVAVFHNGVYSLSGFGMLRFDIVHAAARPGRTVGQFDANVPISQMNDYLPNLIQGECTLLNISELRDVAAAERLRRLNISTSLACPIRNASKQLIAGLFASWDIGDPLPVDFHETMRVHRELAAQIGVALEIRPPLRNAR